MVPEFYLSSLKRRVEAIGKAYPVPRSYGAGSIPVVARLLVTGEDGHILWQIAMAMQYDDGEWVIADVLASYAYVDKEFCERDALLLADYWSLPLYHATSDDGFSEIENVAEIAKELRSQSEEK